MIRLFKKRDEEIALLKKKVEELEELVLCREYVTWKDMVLKNKELASRERNFFLNTQTDTQLLEDLIQRVNKDPDLAVLLRTADGTTLTLRSYPPALNHKVSSALSMLNRGEIQ